MTCEQIQRLLPQYDIDGLDARAVQTVEAHLAQCRACADELAALRRVDAVLTALPRPQAPDDLWTRVAAQTIAAPARTTRPAWGGWWRPAAVTVGLAGVLLAGLFWHPAPRTAALPEQSANAVVAAYVDQYQAARVSDPLADRAALGLTLVKGND